MKYLAITDLFGVADLTVEVIENEGDSSDTSMNSDNQENKV